MNKLQLDGLELMIKRTQSSMDSVDQEIALCQSLVSEEPTEKELSILIAHKARKFKLEKHLKTLLEKYDRCVSEAI